MLKREICIAYVKVWVTIAIMFLFYYAFHSQRFYE